MVAVRSRTGNPWLTETIDNAAPAGKPSRSHAAEPVLANQAFARNPAPSRAFDCLRQETRAVHGELDESLDLIDRTDGSARNTFAFATLCLCKESVH